MGTSGFTTSHESGRYTGKSAMAVGASEAPKENEKREEKKLAKTVKKECLQEWK